MKYIDLRSDTVTKPSPAMREVINSAVVGDDVFGDDPTVNKLQDTVATLFGREAGLFVPSGSMGNLISVKTHTVPGDEIICEESCHVLNYEAGSFAAVGGLVAHTFRGKHGVFTCDEIKPYIKKLSLHTPATKVIALENTHNHAGGTVFPLDEIKKIHKLAKENDIKMHLDGARIWNAHIATGIAFSEYAKYFDSISCCFSKGLGAPIGSMIIGDTDFIDKARRFRKMFGGAMRQVGIIASAALYGVENNIPRMADDHKNANHLAQELAQIKGIDIDLESVQSNIVIMNIASTGKIVADVLNALKSENVLAVQFGSTKIRCVTHLDVSSDNIHIAIEKFKQVFDSWKICKSL